MGACNTCDCNDPLNSIQNDRCTDAGFGIQLTQISIQKMTGVDFDGTNGNDILVEADWDTKIAAIADDKIILLQCNALRPPATPNLLTGNDVPFGGQIALDRPQEINGFITFPSQQTLEDINAASCWPEVKIGFSDNQDWFFASKSPNGEFIPNASIVFDTLAQEGFGTKARIPFKITYNNNCQPVAIAKLPFLRAKTN